MASNNEVKVFFTGDTKGFEKATATVGAKAGGLKKSLLGIGAGVSLVALGKGVLDTAKHFETASLSARDFAKVAGTTGVEAARWQEAAQSIGVDADTVQNAFAKMNAAIGTDTMKAGDKLNKAKDATAKASISVEKAQERYNKAVAKSGANSSSAKSAAVSLAAAQRKLAESGDKVQTVLTSGGGVFADYGIAVAKTKDGLVDTNQTFLNAIQFLKDEKDATIADAAAKKIFGKSFQDLTPLILQGSEGLKSQLASVSDEQAGVGSADSIAKAEKFQAAMDNLGDSFERLKLNLGGFLIPMFSGLFQWLSQLPAPVLGVVAGTLALAFAVSKVSGAISLLTANPWVLALLAAVAVVYLLYKNWDKVTGAINAATAAVQGFADKVAGVLYGPAKSIINFFGGHLGEGGAQLNTDNPAIQAQLQKQGRGFAAGGWVPGPMGSPQVILAHGGEYVSPAGGGGSNIYQTVYVQAVNPYDMNKNLAREAYRANRAGGRR